MRPRPSDAQGWAKVERSVLLAERGERTLSEGDRAVEVR